MVVTGRIEDQRRRLTLADLVGRLHHHRDFAGLGGRELEAPLAEREAPRILAERGAAPVRAAVDRHFDRGHAVAAVPRDALHLDGLAWLRLVAVVEIGD